MNTNTPQFLDFSKFNKKFEVWEDNAGGLHLVTFNSKGQPDFIGAGYEYFPGSLTSRLQEVSEFSEDETFNIFAEYDPTYYPLLDELIKADANETEIMKAIDEIYTDICYDSKESDLIADNEGIHKEPNSTKELFITEYELKNFQLTFPLKQGLEWLKQGKTPYNGEDELYMTSQDKMYNEEDAKKAFRDKTIYLDTSGGFDGHHYEFLTVSGTCLCAHPVGINGQDGDDMLDFYPDENTSFPENYTFCLGLLNKILRLPAADIEKIFANYKYFSSQGEQVRLADNNHGIVTDTKYQNDSGSYIQITKCYEYDDDVKKDIRACGTVNDYIRRLKPDPLEYSVDYGTVEPVKVRDER